MHQDAVSPLGGVTALYARCDSSAFTPLSREMSTEPESTTRPAFCVAGADEHISAAE